MALQLLSANLQSAFAAGGDILYYSPAPRTLWCDAPIQEPHLLVAPSLDTLTTALRTAASFVAAIPNAVIPALRTRITNWGAYFLYQAAARIVVEPLCPCTNPGARSTATLTLGT